MKNWGPYIIKTAVFGTYCLDKLKIVSCQFLATNHWRANALELSSIVKVCGGITCYHKYTSVIAKNHMQMVYHYLTTLVKIAFLSIQI